MSRRHHHGYVCSQFVDRTVYTKRCCHPSCNAIQPTSYGYAVALVVLLVVALLLAGAFL